MEIKSVQRIAEMEGLRGFAILFVILWHFIHNAANLSKGLDESHKAIFTGIPFSLGWTGVDLFFILSGFLIGSSILRVKNQRAGVIGYFVKRIFRIAPVYLTLIAAYLLIYRLGVFSGSAGLANSLLGVQMPPMAAFVTFTNNFWNAQIDSFGPSWLGVTWSLAVEMQFYMIAPIVILSTPQRMLPFICVAIAVSACVFRMFIADHGGRLDAYVLTFGRLDALFMGVFLAWLAHYHPGFSIRGNRASVLAAAALTVCVIVAYFHSLDPRVFSPWMQSIGYTLIGFMYAVIVAFAYFTDPGSVVRRVTSIKAMRWLGDISYPVYLFHFPVHGMVLLAFGSSSFAADTMSALAMGAVSFVVTICVSYVLHICVENPCIAWGHAISRWIRRPERSPESSV